MDRTAPLSSRPAQIKAVRQHNRFIIARFDPAASNRAGSIRMARQRSADPEIEIQLPITPMLDMTFQLLIFFILTFRPANLGEGKLDFSLPAAGHTGNNQPLDMPPPPSEVD